MDKDDRLSIGQIAKRSGVAVSALRYYEAQGLIASLRNAGGQRRFQRSELRRVSFILIAQRLGFTLKEIQAKLLSLPQGRTPTRKDWETISLEIKDRLEVQIKALERMQDSVEGCIGCGCLSLDRCAIYNAQDEAGQKGPGPVLALDGST